MDPIRVLVVDDAAVVRRVVGRALAEDPDIEVVGLATDGLDALRLLPEVRPDVITLDIEMPELDGLGTLVEIRKTHPRLPVIMFSTLSEAGAAITLEALARGASDYVLKPSGEGSLIASIRRAREELVPKIKALSGRIETPRPAPAPAPPSGHARRPSRPPALVSAVVIGVSTGGPNALAALLPNLPTDLGVPVLIVQHMPPVFTRLLAERLTTKSPMPVAEAVTDALVEPGRIWLAAGGSHLEVHRPDDGPARLLLTDEPPENSCRPSVDVLFRSAADVYGSGVLGVVMTGMGRDGVVGAATIRGAGGQVIIQDEPTSVVWGMPGMVAAAGLADAVYPLADMAAAITARVHHRLVPAGSAR